MNKLENFIKNTDGRTIYVNPADLNATDSITNQGTSLTEPFRTIQRALIEAARFSYLRGDDNDLVEKTTIMLYPGEHSIDNRPGYGIRLDGNTPVAVAPSGAIVTDPGAFFNLTSDTNFDIESPNNVLWHFNSIYGGVIVPRGTSIVGMDLRKTKIRPLYVPNPTDPDTPDSAIFRVTGACYFWQFTIFDGKADVPVFTNQRDFSENNKSLPTFSHHKLTAFEYADGVNRAAANGFPEYTDLQMFYSKLSNAYNEASGRDIDQKFPIDIDGFAPQRPEFEIVGAFATDPVNISNIISGDGFVADAVVTVSTATDHNLSVGSPIKIRGVSAVDYNVSTVVSAVIDKNTFTYTLPFVRSNLPARPSTSSATVTVETDTVSGASPYIFNVSMRSVYGINGMHADGSKATGFRSMVVAQFTAISLQKDDRAFVKYNEQARRYDGINIDTAVRGAELSSLSSSTNTSTVYHLDPQAVYRPGWDTTHIKMSNDAVIQIVSVFAIGFNQHFAALTGADASITNSNSNFGQFALLSGGFKNDAFDKDDQGFITQVVTPNTAYNPETDEVEEIEWVNIDFAATNTNAFANQIYLLGYTNKEDQPPAISQSFRIGANYSDKIYQRTEDGTLYSADIIMVDDYSTPTKNQLSGSFIGRKSYEAIGAPQNSVITLPPHGLLTGEKVRIFSRTGDLPENIQQQTLYYAIVISGEEIRLATSEANAFNGIFVEIYGGAQLRIESRVNDKRSGDPGHPIQYDDINKQWFIHTNNNSDLYDYIRSNPTSLEGVDSVSFVRRVSDNRNLNDKLYRLRYVIPRTATNAKPPTAGYVLQYSSSTGARNNDDFLKTDIDQNDYDFERNPSYISGATVSVPTGEVLVTCEQPHRLAAGNKVRIQNIISTDNPDATATLGYNGEFVVTRIDSARLFRYSTTDVNGFTRNPGTFENDTNVRNVLLPRFQRKDNLANIFIYRIEEIVPFRQGLRDGIYHIFLVNGSNSVTQTFTDRKYNQPIVNLYPQLDTDNVNSNPPSTKTFANRAPLGRVTIDEPQNSLTRETIDKVFGSLNDGRIASISEQQSTYTIQFDREHSYNGAYGYDSLVGGSGYTNGVYYAVKLTSSGSWKGTSATVTVSSGSVTDVVITDPGSAHTAGEVLDIDPAGVGGAGAGARITISAAGVRDNTNTVVQVSGAGDSIPTFYSYILSVPTSTSVIIEKPSGTVAPVPGMFVIPVDSGTPVGTVTNATDSEGKNVATITAASNIGFGLQRGNSIVAFTSTGNIAGKFYVKNVPTPTVIELVSTTPLSDISLIGKCGLEDNDASTGSIGENIGVRGASYFGLDTLRVSNSTGTGVGDSITLESKDGGVAFVEQKLPLGTYIQIGAEIMRIASSTFTGTSANIAKVIRGSLGTSIANHPQNSKVRVVTPLPIELRRPSILRASGHTFEYLGYGPGNYSTALPQLQVEQLPEDEVYLVQSQELDCGQVVYTGMSDNGDFYIGNTKYSATSGTQITFDVPVPSVAGEDLSSNNVTFDEVTITRRLFVAGGETNEVQSQFDGPVKFTQPVNIKSNLNVTGSSTVNDLVVQSEKNATSATSDAALKVIGGAAIGLDLYVGGDIEATEVRLTKLESDEIYTNYIGARYPDDDIDLFVNSSNDVTINIGAPTDNGTVRFQSTQPAAGDYLDIENATGSVVVDGGVVIKDTLIAESIKAPKLVPTGTVLMWGGSVSDVPTGFLLCNGASLSRTQYSALFSAIGTIHGSTSPTNFSIPDLRDRFIAGAGSNYNVTDSGGSDTVALTEAQLASHDHGMQVEATTHSHTTSGGTTSEESASHEHPFTTNGGGGHGHVIDVEASGGHNHGGETGDNGRHSHSYERNTGETQAGNGDDGSVNRSENTSEEPNHRHNINSEPDHSHPANAVAEPNHSHDGTTDSGAGSHRHNVSVTVDEEILEHSHVIDPTGSGEAHENRPPYYALCYIISYE